MNTYTVTIRAITIKDVEVTAKDEAAAIEQAHELFNVPNECTYEDYKQKLISIQRNWEKLKENKAK